MNSQPNISERLIFWLGPQRKHSCPDRMLEEKRLEYQQNSLEGLYWMILAEKLQEGMQRAQEDFPRIPEFALYQYLLFYGFTELELGLLQVQGKRTPSAMEDFFSQHIISMEGINNNTKKGQNGISTGPILHSVRHRSASRQETRYHYFLSINAQSTRGYLNTGEKDFLFPLCGNHLQWRNRRYRWYTPEKKIKISSRHLNRFVQGLFPPRKGFRYQAVKEPIVKIHDTFSNSSFRLPLSLAQHSTQSSLLKKAYEEDVSKSREILAISHELRKAGRSAIEMLGALEEQKSAHDFMKYREMPLSIAHELDSWPEVFKSPFSHSYYNMAGKSWSETPDGILRISDHWNFQSHGSLHGKTDRPVTKGYWAIGRYCSHHQHYLLLESAGPDEARREDFVALNQRIDCLKRFLL